MQGDVIYRILFGAILALNFGMAARFRSRAQAGRRFDYAKEGRPMFLALRLSGLAIMAYCILYIAAPETVAWSLHTEPVWLRLGAAVVGLGPLPAFISWAQNSIGDNVSPTVTTREGQSLITHGPYAWIRNPLYMGGFTLIGTLALVAGSALLAAAAFIALILVSVRLPKEEAELEARFGDDWRAYRAGTGRFLPRIRRRSAVLVVAIGSAVMAATLVTACESSPTDVKAIVLYVSAEAPPCAGVGPRTCLFIREDPDADWEFFYDPIEGFVWEPGYEYRLSVFRTTVLNPPADGSIYRYVLLEVLEKTRK